MKNKKPDILAIIPARSGSKGIKNKNIKKIKDKSLIQHAIDTAIYSKLFSQIILTSDSEKYKKEVNPYKKDVDFILREKKLASDKSNTLDTWRDSLRKCEKKYNKIFNYSFLIEPTNPMRNASDLKKLYNIINNSKYDGVLTLSPTPESFTKEKTLVIKNKKISYYIVKGAKYSIRQNIPKQFHRNGIGYVAKRDYIFNCRNNFLSGKIGFLIIDRININIDNINDFNIAKILIENDKKFN